MISLFNNLNSETFITRKTTVDFPGSTPYFINNKRLVFFKKKKRERLLDPTLTKLMSKQSKVIYSLNKEKDQLSYALDRLPVDKNHLTKPLGVLGHYIKYWVAFLNIKELILGRKVISSKLLRIYSSRTLGFKDLLSENFKSLKRNKRIKDLQIKDMIDYSYKNDLRFVLVLSFSSYK